MQVIKPIGGEQWFDIHLFDKEADLFRGADFTFLSGGQSALNYIVSCLSMKEDEYILLPAYLCPTIVWNLDRNHIRYVFYRIGRDLSVDLGDLCEKLENGHVRAVFLLDYFGFYHDPKTRSFLLSLKERNIRIIEDAAQMLWFSRQEFIGDYCFNSYRKFLPIDGSIVLSQEKGVFEGFEDEYYEYMNMARLRLTAYVKFGIGSKEDFVSLFSQAEDVYGKDLEIRGMTDISRYLLSIVDVMYISAARRTNYAYLQDILRGLPGITPLFDKAMLSGNIPIGYPILIEDRDRIKKALREESIYCAAHWPILREAWAKDYEDSIYIAERILTLPIDQRYGPEDMDRLADALQKQISMK